MKIAKSIIILGISMALIASCKKSNDQPAPEPSPAPAPAPPPPVTLNATISGTAASGNQIAWSTSGPYKSVSWNLGNNNSLMFSTSKAIAGTYTLTKVSDNQMYLWYNGKGFLSSQGSITITAIDTAADRHIKRLKGNFSFKTDTNVNSSYNVTSGSFDWTEQ